MNKSDDSQTENPYTPKSIAQESQGRIFKRIGKWSRAIDIGRMIVIAVAVLCLFHLLNWNSNYAPFVLYIIFPTVLSVQALLEVTVRMLVHRIGDAERNSGSGDEKAR
jgi:hypothetical protein